MGFCIFNQIILQYESLCPPPPPTQQPPSFFPLTQKPTFNKRCCMGPPSFLTRLFLFSREDVKKVHFLVAGPVRGGGG